MPHWFRSSKCMMAHFLLLLSPSSAKLRPPTSQLPLLHYHIPIMPSSAGRQPAGLLMVASSFDCSFLHATLLAILFSLLRSILNTLASIVFQLHLDDTNPLSPLVSVKRQLHADNKACVAMLSLCGCSSRRRAKKSSNLSIDNVTSKVKARPVPSEMTHSAVVPQDLGRLSLDDFGIQTSDVPKRRSSNALEAVKAKLIRHLSYDKDPPQKPQDSPDIDKDEIARRAELRRFRAKRIQEELIEDPSKSLSTHNSIRSTRFLSPFINIGRPGHGPRDAIEFSIDSGSHLPVPCPSPLPSMSDFKLKAPNTSIKRWTSCPATIGEQPGQVSESVYNPSNASLSWKRYTTPGKIPESRSLPNLLQPNMRAPQLARTKTTTLDSESHATLDVWLALQHSRSRDSAALSVRDQRLLSPGMYRRQNTPVDNSSPDVSQGTVTIPHPVRQGGTSQRCPSVSRTAAQQRGSQATTSSKPGSASRSRQRSLAVPFDTKRNASSSSSHGRILPPETPGGIASSYYPSVMPSIQPSPSRSNSLVNVLSMQDLQSLELSPFECEYSLTTKISSNQ